jgi:hypothetical protein
MSTLLTYFVRRSSAVPEPTVCFLGRFLPKLGGASGAALSGRVEWSAGKVRAADRLLCAFPSERGVLSPSGTAMTSGWASTAADGRSFVDS